MLCIRDGRFQRPGQKHNSVKHGRFFQAAAKSRLFTASSYFRK